MIRTAFRSAGAIVALSALTATAILAITAWKAGWLAALIQWSVEQRDGAIIWLSSPEAWLILGPILGGIAAIVVVVLIIDEVTNS